MFIFGLFHFLMHSMGVFHIVTVLEAMILLVL